jgi:hypothetical protein
LRGNADLGGKGLELTLRLSNSTQWSKEEQQVNLDNKIVVVYYIDNYIKLDDFDEPLKS